MGVSGRRCLLRRRSISSSWILSDLNTVSARWLLQTRDRHTLVTDHMDGPACCLLLNQLPERYLSLRRGEDCTCITSFSFFLISKGPEIRVIRFVRTGFSAFSPLGNNMLCRSVVIIRLQFDNPKQKLRRLPQSFNLLLLWTRSDQNRPDQLLS